MGLPVWRAPSPEPSGPSKVDLSAPARSPIRRRSLFASRRARPTRPPRSPRSNRLSEHDVRALESSARPAPAPEGPWTRPSSRRQRLPPPPVPESRHYEQHGEPARDQEEDMFLDDFLVRREEFYRSVPDATRPAFGELTRSPRQLPALTPNFAPAAASRDYAAESTATQMRMSQTAASSFLAAASHSRAPGRSRDSRPPVPHPDNYYTVDFGDDDGSDNNAVPFPPLRRMGRRTIADGPLPSSSLRESWSPATTLDGLGDRERSMSPVHDHWDTMLSTVAPDPLPPTADSSFTSAAASASFSNSHPSSRASSSNSNSAASSRTHLTVPSRRHSPSNEFNRACETSDSDPASDTEEEDMYTRHSVSSLRRRNRQGDEPPSRDPMRYSRRVRDRSQEASTFTRSFFGEAPREGAPRTYRRTEAPSVAEEDPQTLDQDMRDARALLERLAQRPDLPDDFWASVGLMRSMADRVEQLQRREPM